MLDWYERQVERVVRGMRELLLGRMHPELKRIAHAHQREMVSRLASQDEPAWRRRMSIWICLLIAPVLCAIAVMTLAGESGLMNRHNWPYVAIASWIGGSLTAAWVIEWLRRRRVRTVCYRTLRLIGDDVCPTCGYLMMGHPCNGIDSRTCPECGGGVPPISLPKQQRKAG